jgi:lysophospholipid acyltransferase (LPLAT)-like uncharacterized protein
MKPWIADLAAAAGAMPLDGLLRTLSFETHGEPTLRTIAAREPVIIAIWHGRLLPATFYHRNEGLASLVSRSADGDLIARVLERWGYRAVRGSSSRGGSEALRQIVRMVRSGQSVAITPDGPRGPRRKMKPGAVLAASMAGVPILPMSSGTPRAWWFGRWDRFLVPKPFARVKIVYGPPMYVPARASPEEVEAASIAVEQALEAATHKADEP